jgi:hypothetical protein
LNSSCSTPSKISCMISGIIPPPHMSKYFNCTNKLLWLIPYLLDTSTESLSGSSNSYKCCRWSSLLRSTNNFSVNYVKNKYSCSCCIIGIISLIQTCLLIGMIYHNYSSKFPLMINCL